MSNDKKDPQQDKQVEIQVHVPPALEYTYRDVFNVFVSPGEVVIELGNRHRSMPDHISIANRIVLSVPNAHNLAQSIHAALKQVEEQIKDKIDVN